ncbi:hypothetical protein [Amphritea japonica]|uniref:Uncharacterized protein n=1 Tax=Amphritea japonica ATCC BAA-1530 TaxID=1278309 RepID=A0A7R6SRS0_9GAMM|nr:hypothetical protein [Amphritea japonica]BBB25471.1 conserved hypothetical protein [Amphritea japonica ATCC BAA-1530]
MIKFTRKLALLPALALIALCIPVTQWGLGDINAYPVRYSISKWQSENRLPTHQELNKAQVAIEAALSWDSNPEYYDYQGRLFHYEALISDSPLLQTTALHNALASYQHSTALRPRWAYSQANFALIKALLKEFDEDYKIAIKQAAISGPWENGVNIALAEAGLLGWLSLNPQERKIITDNIQRGIRRNMEHIKIIINRYNKRSLVCANLQRDIYQRKLCGF